MCLSLCRCTWRTPVRVHVLADKIHFPSCGKHTVCHKLVISQAGINIVVTPSVIIKERTVRLGETMQVYCLAIRIHQITAIHVELLQFRPFAHFRCLYDRFRQLRSHIVPTRYQERYSEYPKYKFIKNLHKFQFFIY